MTDGLNNPNESSDDDWTMSEPEIPVKKEVQAKPIDEKAASLYAPPDTGDLEDWDITTKDVSASADLPPNSSSADSPPPTSPPEPQGYNTPTAFMPPQKAFEILKPVAPPRFTGEDWGVSTPKPENDGWKMPEPTFRVTEGEILTKVRKSSSKSDNSAAPGQKGATTGTHEILPDIYAPPDTQETITEDFDLSVTREETPEELNFGGAIPASNISQSPQQQAPVKAPAPTKSRKWLFIILGILAAGAFVLIVLAAVFGFFFYSSRN